MSEPFLILHKVRGLPAFDIAERNDDMGTPSDPGPWWIIPTSGHRAYPYWHLPINFYNGTASMYLNQGPDIVGAHWNLPDMPDDLPDHYAASASRSRLATAASDILSLMGIGKAKAQAPVKRRTIP